MAAALLGQLRRKFPFLFLEIVEFHFDQFVLPKGNVQSGKRRFLRCAFWLVFISLGCVSDIT